MILILSGPTPLDAGIDNAAALVEVEHADMAVGRSDPEAICKPSVGGLPGALGALPRKPRHQPPQRIERRVRALAGFSQLIIRGAAERLRCAGVTTDPGLARLAVIEWFVMQV